MMAVKITKRRPKTTRIISIWLTDIKLESLGWELRDEEAEGEEDEGETDVRVGMQESVADS